MIVGNKTGKLTIVKQSPASNKTMQLDPDLTKNDSTTFITSINNRQIREEIANLLENNPGSPKPDPKSPKPDSKIPTVPAPSLIGMINTQAAIGKLIYLWPYAEWIKAVMYEYTSTPKPLLPCSTISSEDRNETIRIESYYEYSDTVSNRKMSDRCNRAALVTVISAISSIIPFVIFIGTAPFVF